VDQLIKLKREKEALERSKLLFHLSTSFVGSFISHTFLGGYLASMRKLRVVRRLTRHSGQFLYLLILDRCERGKE
jgi:hypothetical protein